MTDNTELGVHRLETGNDGSGLFAVEYNSKSMEDNLEDSLVTKQVQPSNKPGKTPTGTGEASIIKEDTGPVVRMNDFRTRIGSVGLESLSIENYELSKAINRHSQEVFANDFPYLKPVKDDSNEKQKERIQKRFRKVNEAGQTLDSLLKTTVQDHSRLGTGMIILRTNYTTLEGEIVENVEEIVRGDAKVIRPVTDKNNHLGGLYACPIHREDVLESDGVCNQCGCELREVTYARTDSPSSTNIKDVFFDNEIISFSFHNTRLQGRDGLSPVANVWKQAYILKLMRNYVGTFFDDNSGDQYPNKLLFVTTDNADAFEKQAQEAKDSAQDNPYEQGILFFENTELDVQVVDMMSDQILGQSESIKKDYKSAIRSQYGLTDLNDSANEEGGLSRGTKQMDVLNRNIKAFQQDLRREVLVPLEEALGITDYEIQFIGPDEEDEKVSIKEKAEALKELSEAGVGYEIKDGDIRLVDSDVEDQDPSQNTAEEETVEESGETK